MPSQVRVAAALGAGTLGLLMLFGDTVGAQERVPPWQDRSGSQVQPYDDRRDGEQEPLRAPPYDSRQPRDSYDSRPYGSGGASGYAERGRDDAYRPPRSDTYPQGGYQGGYPSGADAGRRDPIPYGGEPAPYGADRPSGDRYGGNGGYRDQGPSYGRPYEAGPTYDQRDAYNAPPPPRRFDRHDGRPSDGTFSMGEIRDAGHGFFGSISQGLASVIEHAFKRQGRPNGYILGEDVGGAFVAGLRYGEGTLYTKDAGSHKVYWQGPSIGYDAGAEGSKVMVLVYNLRDPSDIYERFGGVAGSAYVVGGVGLTFQSHGDVVLAPIRSGIGLRLGANIGYLKYTRRPTWNPF